MNAIEISLDYVNAAKLLLPALETITIALVGCGGTGSWLAPSVARIGRLLMEKYQRDTRLYFIDPDHVEAKNCYRQNFCSAEIGHNKADMLAVRYGTAWGVEIGAIGKKFKKAQLKTEYGQLFIIIGCVDNADARHEISEAVTNRYTRENRCWWLDCGNHQSAGQVVVGCGAGRPKDPFGLPGFCSWLPLPSVQHTDLLVQEPIAEDSDADLSCADMAMRDSQGLAINQRIAAEATDYLVRLLLTRDLQKMATYIDLASGTTKSKYITVGNLEEK